MLTPGPLSVLWFKMNAEDMAHQVSQEMKAQPMGPLKAQSRASPGVGLRNDVTGRESDTAAVGPHMVTQHQCLELRAQTGCTYTLDLF